MLQDLLNDPTLRGAALRGLAAYDDPATPKRILQRYSSLTDEEKADAVSTLASRATYALALLEAIEAGNVARDDLSPLIARQLIGLNDSSVREKLEKTWGAIRPASESKGPLLAKFKSLLTFEYLQGADLPHGRQLFQRHCAACHTLFGEGGRIAPELTGAQRTNLDYVLENLADPSAVVPRDYQVTLVQTSDGRLLSGIIREETDQSLTVQTATEAVVLPKDEIEAREQTAQSMMPEGVLAALSEEEVRDLVAYLASPNQVPLPAAGE
jgi:putative heme-binding domain-containing protein